MLRLEIVCKSISTMFERVLTLNVKDIDVQIFDMFKFSYKIWYKYLPFKNKHPKKIHIVQGCIYKPLIVWGNICVCVSNIGFYFGGTYDIPLMMYIGIKIVFHIWMGNMEQWTYTFWHFHKTFGKKIPELQIWYLSAQIFCWSCKA
jgi:hypothetical protein